VSVPLPSSIDRIREILDRWPGVRLAVLFGSMARGQARPESDLDLGIVAPQLDGRDELTLQAQLERSAGRPVDLVRLDRASTLIRWYAARDGILVLARDRREWVGFLARSAGEHADLAPTWRRAADLYRARLMEARGA
jgi:predicted nucleotidyltransferase